MLTAHFQVQYLLQFEDTRDLEEAIKNIPVLSENAFPSGRLTAGFPTSPQDVYRNVIDKMCEKKALRLGDQPLRILSWILYAARPLKVEELVEALAVGEHDKELLERRKAKPKDIVKGCEPLVDYDEHTRIVKFTHDTVREFLEEHCTNKLSAPHDLAKICLYYLGLIEFDEPCPDEKALEIRLTKRSFTKYACEFWGYHAQGTPKDEAEIEHVTNRVLGTANRMQAVAQINRYASLGEFKIPQNTTLFHNLALNGLSTLCKIQLDKAMQGGGK